MTGGRPALPALRASGALESETRPRTTPTSVDSSRQRWYRPALWGLLAATAVLYMWGLGASGWANDFYAAAAQAGSESWKAFFFGSSDAAGSITVDKPPLSLWAMALSVRMFGLSSWSILLPQALMGVGAVAVVVATVRRWFGAPAGLLAGAVFALTPVATLMFRFNNPDALLVLLLVVAAYCLVRALEHGSPRWLALVGVAIGLGFLTKMLQALLVLPGFAAVYLLAAPVALSRRVRHLVVAGAAMVAAAAWWVVIVELTPASARPYMGGSQTNSVLELVFGYNGFGRLTGDETGSVGGPPGGGGGMWGTPSWHRMFDATWAGQIAWLIPAALVAVVAVLVLRRSAPRTDRVRAAALLWGGWLIVTQIVFSFGRGIIHEYYAVALAPPTAALVAIGAVTLWAERHRPAARLAIGATVAGSAWLAHDILGNAPDWYPVVGSLVVATGMAATALIVAGDRLHRTPVLAAVAGVAALLIAPAAYSLQTAATAHSGAIPTAGPRAATAGGGPGGGGLTAGGAFGRPGAPPAGAGPGAAVPGAPGMGAGGPGGLLDGAAPSAELAAVLMRDADRYTWIAATVGANRAAGYQLATQRSVMPIGGFNGSDPAPSLARFQELVRAGRVHWFIAGGGFGNQLGGSDSAAQIAQWVAGTFTSTTIDGVTLYDLTTGAETLLNSTSTGG